MRSEDIKSYLEEAKFYILNNRFKEAEEYLDKLLQEEPNNVEVLFYMGLLNEMLNNFTEARQFYEKVLELSPEHEGALSHLSRLQGK